jgi:TolB-like protein
MTKKANRLLAAIMFTDMVGYTALMQENEVKAKSNRDRHRKILNQSIAKHRGEILQYYGDGTLSIFKSAIEAVVCAIQIQVELQKEPKIPLRIGIHCGDIVYDDEGVYGDCVNVTSRIEGLAVSGSVLISDKVFDEIKNQPTISKVSLGTFELKNVKKPVTVYAISNEGLVIPSAEEILSSTEDKVKSLAVLPFVNMSSDPENEYFSDGITEEIINALTNLGSLKVIARTSAFAFKGKYEDVRAIGKKLNVDTILEGSVRKAGDRLRITAQLIKILDGSHLWSEKYDRDVKNVFDIQDEISLAIVDKLKVKLLGEEKAAMLKRHTEDLEAYNLYLKGRYFLDSRHEDAIQKAMGCFKKAFEKDPSYTLAYIGLADCFNILGFHTFIEPLRALSEAKSLAQKALELDDTIGEAHASYGFLKWAYEWDWVNAEKALKRAIELNPMYPNVHYWYSLYLVTRGRTEESLTEIKLVQQLQPLSVYLRSGMGAILFWARQYDRALEKTLEALEMNPYFGTVHFVLGWIYEQKKMYKEAISAFKKAIKILGFSYMGPLLGHAYAISGKRKEAEKIITEVNELSKQQYVSSFHRSAIHIALKDNDQAFELLDKAYENRDNWLVTIKIDPRFDSVRMDSRYIQLLQKLDMHK